MAITLSNATAQVAVVFDHIHLVNLSIDQDLFYNNALQPMYKVKISYKMFGVDTDNNRHYRPEVFEIEVPDFIALATESAMQGDMTLYQAFGCIELAIANIIKKDQGLDTSVS